MKYLKLEIFYDNKITLSKINIEYLFKNFGKLTHFSRSEIEKRSPATMMMIRRRNSNEKI